MYKQLYKKIIDNAKLEKRNKNSGTYYELHHVVPEFLFKNRKRKGPAGHLDGNCNAVDNLVLLTFQEHLMAHYYLYEILKHTRYEHSAGSALQFFFVKATGGHIRQRELTEVDEKFLNEMAHLRQIGIDSISKARKGKMPVVDAITRETIGSMPVDHPRVLSGEWVHHSKGIKQTWAPQVQSGKNNNNYKEMTEEKRQRALECVSRSLVDDCYFSKKKFSASIKEEFSEFKKISVIWIINNFGSVESLIREYNTKMGTTVIYNPVYRSSEHRKMLSIESAKYCTVTNDTTKLKIKKDELVAFLNNNPEYRRKNK